MKMVRYFVTFSYLGTRYRGLQKLPTHPGETVQDILELGFQSLCPKNDPKTVTCSRTDKGVHALMNALHVDLEHNITGETFQPHFITETVNEFLKKCKHSIIVTKTCIVPDTFNARRFALWRSYIYRTALLKPHLKEFSYRSIGYSSFLPICEKDRCYIVHGSLDTDRINEAARHFIGTHDFRTFGKYIEKNDRDPVRTVHEFKFIPSQVPMDSRFDPLYDNIDMWEFHVKANSYLYHQVRKMVGMLIAVGYGFFSPNDVKDMLDRPDPYKWRKSFLPPAEGLYLSEIYFERKAFQWTDEKEDQNEQTNHQTIDDHKTETIYA